MSDAVRAPESPPRLHTRPSSVHGLGVFAGEAIPAGAVVREYRGERIGPAEARRREEASPGLTYILAYDESLFLDGAVGGDESRFLNHSCAPNSRIVRGGGRAWIVARQDIPPDAELTFDYAFDPDDPPVPCRCGAPGCRGVLNEIPAPGPSR